MEFLLACFPELPAVQPAGNAMGERAGRHPEPPVVGLTRIMVCEPARTLVVDPPGVYPVELAGVRVSEPARTLAAETPVAEPAGTSLFELK